MRSGRICGAYGSCLSDSDDDDEFDDVGCETTYHSRTRVLLRRVKKVKSSETSWIAVHGHECTCVVTYHDKTREKPEDLFELHPLHLPEAIVSLRGTSEVHDGCGIAASLAKFNEIVAIEFLEKILKECSVFSYDETIQIAISAFRYLLHGNIKGNIKVNEIEIYVMGRDKKVTALPVQEIKAHFDAGYEATKSKRDEITYHRRTQVGDDGHQVQNKVKSFGTSWIAVQGQEAVCRVNRVTALEKSEKPDLIKIFHVPFSEAQANVSVALGTNEVQDGSGTAASIADINEKPAIKFLVKKLHECPTLAYEETVQTAISALCCLYPGNLEANEIEVFVVRKNEKVTRALPTKEIEDLLATCKSGNLGISRQSDVGNRENRSLMEAVTHAWMTSVPFSCVDVDCQSMKTCSQERGETSHGKSKISYSRETQIWCGGCDSQLLKSFGFSWIAVQGKDSICVVTRDKVLGVGFLKSVLSRMKGVDLCSKTWPFATVSVVVDSNEVQEESGHGASSAEIKAVVLLKKKMKSVSDFTYGGTIQTAISALLCLTQKDLNAEEMKACVWRNVAPFASNLETDEIEEHLLVVTKTPKRKTLKRKTLAEGSGSESE